MVLSTAKGGKRRCPLASGAPAPPSTPTPPITPGAPDRPRSPPPPITPGHPAAWRRAVCPFRCKDGDVSDLRVGREEPELGSEPEPLLANRPMLMAGAIAALAAAGGGLAVLVTLTLIGWITAPHVGPGGGLAGVLRSAGLLWLVAHHVEVTVRGVGRIGLLPLGLVLLPAALLERAGRWMVHEGHVKRLRDVALAAASIAFPYTLFAGAVAVASRSAQAAPSLWQAVLAG